MPEIVTPDLTGQANKYIKVNAGGTGYEFGTPGGGPGAVNWGDVGGTLSDQTDLQTALNSKANSLGPDENYVTDAQLVVIGNTSGTNSGNETASTLGVTINASAAATPNDTDLVATVDTSVVKKITWTNVKAFLKTYFDTLYQAAGTYLTSANIVETITNGVTTNAPSENAVFDALALKQDVLTNGYGLSGTTTKAVSLTSSSAFATAETTISAATYADIAGASISLAAGTWMVIGQVNARAANAIIQCFVAITDGANAVISEIAMSRPASGTSNLNSPISCNVVAIVSPIGTTTYKLRGARGLTTHTGSWIAMDGNGVNTTSHVSNNTDKGTGIFAIRIA